jgi:hypothetical protein
MDERKPTPLPDLLSGLVWFALAVAIMIGSWRMDRLVHLKVSPYSVPGLVPGLLGAAIALMGAVLILRALREGALTRVGQAGARASGRWRLPAALLLCLGFALALVGTGLPFWLGAALFVTAFVFVFQFADRRAAGTLLRGLLFAAAYGLIAGLVVYYVFQELFLVRLP